MLKILILISLSLNIAFAKSRFTDVEKKKFMDGVQKAISNSKEKNKGKVDLKIIKPIAFDFLQSSVKEKNITPDEMEKIKKRYEDLLKNTNLKPDNTEEMLNKFVKEQLNEVDQAGVEKIKEGKVCNNWKCEDGLQCARALNQGEGQSCKMLNLECKDDKDCCSSSCKLDQASKKKLCEAVSVCYKPVALGQSCMDNPICAAGTCSLYDSKTLGIGECTDNGASCKQNTECCSNSCSNNKCVMSRVCKDCTSNGKKAEHGKKCCEGLYRNEEGMCIPDLPPVVIPQVRTNVFNNVFMAIGDFFISSAHADAIADAARTAADRADQEATDAENAARRSPNCSRRCRCCF